MKVVIFAPYALWDTHFETDLELAMLHIQQGHETHLVLCNRSLPTCEPNRNFLISQCLLCQSRAKEGIKRLGTIPQERIHWFKARTPSSSPDFSGISFSDLKNLESFTYDGIPIGLAVASSLITTLRNPEPDLEQSKTYISKALESFMAAYQQSSDIVARVRPDRAYVFNGRFCSTHAIFLACRRQNIEVFTHERSGTLEQYMLLKNSRIDDLEDTKRRITESWKIHGAPGTNMEPYHRWFHDRRTGRQQGWISYCAGQSPGRLPEGFDPKARNITIFHSSEDEYASAPEWKNRLYDSQLPGLVHLLSHPWPPDIRFYLRLHPYVAQGSPQDLRRFMDLRHPQLSVIAPSSTVNSYDLMLASEKVISFGSTIGIESVYWGKPSILLGRTNYEDLNACYVPKTKEEAISMISDPRLPAKSSVCALPYACYIVNQGTPYIYFRPLSLDGGTFLGKRLTASLPARIVSALLRIWYTVTNSREPIIKISHGTH